MFSSSVDLAGFGTFDDLESGGPGGPGAKVKKVSRIARNGSFSSLSQVRSHHFWVSFSHDRSSTTTRLDLWHIWVKCVSMVLILFSVSLFALFVL